VVLAAEDGAPEAWIGDRRAPCTLSISHRDGRACCAVAGPSVELGCDLELVEPRSEAFVDDYFTAAEADAVRSAGRDERDLMANLTWSAKESVLKALRTGLRADTRTVVVLSVEWPPGEAWARFDAVDESNEGWRGWWARRDGFVLTVASRPAADRPVDLGRTP
jgi:4'-phosphopantetheinyl transferase